jgi:hypothetical protein
VMTVTNCEMIRANVSDPVVTFQDADELERPINSEGIDRESFLMRDRTEEEVVDSDRVLSLAQKETSRMTLRAFRGRGAGLKLRSDEQTR